MTSGASQPRWPQRLASYRSSLEHLSAAVDLYRMRDLSVLERAGLAQLFEVSWDLAWQLMADFMTAEGKPPTLRSPRHVIREAFAAGLIDNGELWMETIDTRNMFTHVYNEERLNAGLSKVVHGYFATMVNLAERIDDHAVAKG